MITVVTGANAFLASHLIPYLADQGVTIFATYRTWNKALNELSRLPQVHLVQLDLSEASDFHRLPERADALVHVAAASVSRPGDIGEFILSNVNGTQNIARYAQNAGIKRVVYTSTISVYGEIGVPILEETCPIKNPDNYGLTKYLAERVFAETRDIPCVALRLPGILGKGAHRAWIPSLVDRVLGGDRKANIYNSTSLFNNAVHVGDLSEFIWRLLKSDMSGFCAINLAAADFITIQEVIDLISYTLGETLEITQWPAPKPSFTISSERAKKLGYKPCSIKQILKRYLEEVNIN